MNRHDLYRYGALTVVPVALCLLVAGCGPPSGAARPVSSPPSSSSRSASVESTRSPGPPPGSSAVGACGAAPAGPSGVGSELAGVQFVSGAHGWVVGLGRILGTDDGGRHWVTEYRTTAQARLGSVDFADAAHGWVVGSSTLLATTDGGARWRKLPEPCPALDAVHFISSAVGWAVAGGSASYSGAQVTGGVLLTTTDGGRHWRRRPAPADVQTACLADPRHGWLGAGGHIYATADGGRTWTLAVRGPGARPGVAVLAEVECAGPAAAWAELIGPGAASNQQPHVGYHAAGDAWTPIFAEQYFPHPGVAVSANSPGSVAGPFSAVGPAEAVFIDLCPVCGAGTSPMDLARDGGRLLDRRGNVGGLTQATAAAFITLDDGWVVGTRTTYHPAGGVATVVSRIVHTANGGRTWQVQYTTGR